MLQARNTEDCVHATNFGYTNPLKLCGKFRDYTFINCQVSEFSSFCSSSYKNHLYSLFLVCFFYSILAYIDLQGQEEAVHNEQVSYLHVAPLKTLQAL